MIYEARTFRLKDGQVALFRSPVLADAAQMLEYLKTTAGETEFVIRYPEGCTESEAQETKFLQSIIDSPINLMIVCEINGQIAGSCQLALHGRIKTRHRAGIAIALKREFWGPGIGTSMLEEMIRIAKEYHIIQLELEVIQGNVRAMALYQKMGFDVVAAKPDAIRLKDGTLLDEYIMMKKIIAKGLRKTPKPFPVIHYLPAFSAFLAALAFALAS